MGTPNEDPTSATGPGARPDTPTRYKRAAAPEGREKPPGPRSAQARPGPPRPAPPHSLLHVLAQRLAQALLGRLQLAHVSRHRRRRRLPERRHGREARRPESAAAARHVTARPAPRRTEGAVAARRTRRGGGSSGGHGSGRAGGAAVAMPGLLLGDEAPNFEADTTEGRIRFHDFLGDS